MRKIKIWFGAIFMNRKYCRVRYNDGRQTRLMDYETAQKHVDFFYDGEIFIDYTAKP